MRSVTLFMSDREHGDEQHVACCRDVHGGVLRPPVTTHEYGVPSGAERPDAERRGDNGRRRLECNEDQEGAEHDVAIGFDFEIRRRLRAGGDRNAVSAGAGARGDSLPNAEEPETGSERGSGDLREDHSKLRLHNNVAI